MAALASAEDRELIQRCWQDGDLSYLLHDGQMDMRAAWRSAGGRLFVMCIPRRFGKSYYLCVEGVEECVKRPNAQVRYAAPTGRMCRSIVEPHMKSILNDCPKNMRPSYSRNAGRWVFPNGSEFVMAGCDLGGVERLRGTSMTLGLVDEAGFFSEDLNYVYRDVLMPQLLTTNGRIIMCSTPARSPAHPFTKYCIDAQARGCYMHRTIFDAPHIPREVAVEFIEEVGGIESTTARREYLAEVVVDDELAVIPEFYKNKDRIIVDSPMPEFYDAYVFADFGFNDFTAIGFYVFDFARGKLMKIDELEFIRANTGDIAPAIKAKEAELWGKKKPLARIADAPLQQLADLAEMHKLPFVLARKDDADAALNGLRLSCVDGYLEVHPRCRRTAAHLEHAIWRSNRKDYDRSGDFGHFDFVDETKYAVRHVDRSKNPYPLVPGHIRGGTHHIPEHWPGQRYSGNTQSLLSMIGRR